MVNDGCWRLTGNYQPVDARHVLFFWAVTELCLRICCELFDLTVCIHRLWHTATTILWACVHWITGRVAISPGLPRLHRWWNFFAAGMVGAINPWHRPSLGSCPGHPLRTPWAPHVSAWKLPRWIMYAIMIIPNAVHFLYVKPGTRARWSHRFGHTKCD